MVIKIKVGERVAGSLSGGALGARFWCANIVLAPLWSYR